MTTARPLGSQFGIGNRLHRTFGWLSMAMTGLLVSQSGTRKCMNDRHLSETDVGHLDRVSHLDETALGHLDRRCDGPVIALATDVSCDGPRGSRCE
jgi:hypothetical protein